MSANQVATEERDLRGHDIEENKAEAAAIEQASSTDGPPAYEGASLGQTNTLKRNLVARHMQFIAMGGAIGAGLFVGTGSALYSGGPGALLICYLITGGMLLLTIQALGELAVVYPENGAFFTYCVRFISPAWGFAVGWDYALSWLTVLPFELTAASITISYWNSKLNVGIFITIFLVALIIVNVFGVRGYGEVEFVLALTKITALIGFIILGIVIDCGGAPKGGYIGTKYWRDPGAFTNFEGFCSVFVVCAFAFAGTELSGLAAAEAANPAKTIPKATKQVFWRIIIFYVVGTFIVGLIVPRDSHFLLGSSGANTKASPFVVSIQQAGIQGLPSVMNAVITLAVLSVANSATYGSSRTVQALAAHKMAPKFLAYIDKKGRPVWCIVLQILFALLAFINESPKGGQIFTWLLALSGISNFFVWGSICLAHIRFRQAWKHNGRDVKELAFAAPFGIPGSAIGFGLVVLCLMATFYVAIVPMSAMVFFENYLALFIVMFLMCVWGVWGYINKDPELERGFWFLKVQDMDIYSNMRDSALDVGLEPRKEYHTIGEWLKAAPMRIFRSLF